MFDWLYKRVLDGIMRNIDFSKAFLEITSNEECQKQILAMTDQLYERYKYKTLGSLGGLQKGMNYAQQDGSIYSQILDSRGRIQLKGLIPYIIEYFRGKQPQNTSELTKSLIPKELQL